jgi:hypothetical protein
MDAGMALQIFLAAVAAGWLFLIYLGVGGLACRRLGIGFDDPLLDTLVKTGLGFGAVGNCIMLLCFFHCATPLIIIVFLVACSCISLPFLRREKNRLLGHARAAIRHVRQAHPLVSATVCILLFGYCLRGLLPPSDFDGLMYHLPAAKLFLSHGGFYHIFFNSQTDYPLLTEMHYMLGLALQNDIICKTLSFFLGCLACAVVIVLCRRYCGGGRITLPSLLVFLTFTNTIANMSNCYVDIPQAVWTMLAVICLEESLSKGRRRFALCAGMFAGMAMQTKIFGVLVLPVLLYQIFLSRRKTAAKPLLADCLAVFLPALFLGFPWYVKSFLYNGTILAIGHETIKGQGLGHPMGILVSLPVLYWIVDVVVRILSAPWTFSLFVHQHQADSFGPLAITVLPFLIFVNVPTTMRALLVYAGVFFAGVLCMEMWFIPGGSSIRYSTFILLIAAPLIVWTVSRLADHPNVKRMLAMAVICMVALGAVLFFKRYHAEWKALATMQSRDAYYASVLPEYPVIRAVNAIRDGSTVMATYNYVNYLIDVPYIAAYRRYASDEGAIADFRQRNIRYIFANDKFDTLANRNAFPPSLPKQCVASANGYYLFKLLW